MRWNEISRKTIGILIAVGVLFAGTVVVVAVMFVRQRGGDTMVKIVQDAVKSNRIVSDGESAKVVADRLLVTMRPEVARTTLEDIARRIGSGSIKVRGVVAGEEGAYIVSFPPATMRELRQISNSFKRYPDVLDALMISAE